MLDGLLLIDKPTGVTSHDVVHRVRKTLNLKSVGHAGTLDPLASGLLICLLGEATKMSNYVMSDDKVYSLEVKLGTVTDSGDITGTVLAEFAGEVPSHEQVLAAAMTLKGELDLPVPKVSAIKIQGKKLYEYAREGLEITPPTKRMVIHEVKSLGYKAPVAEFEIHCSKGTYIRSWAEKLGEILGVGGTVQNLRRLQSGKFQLNQAITLDMVPNYSDLLNKVHHCFIPLSDILSTWPGLKVRDRDEKLIRNGQVPKGMESYLNHLNIASGVRVLSEKGSLLALLNHEKAAEGTRFTIARVFNTDSSN